MDFNDLQIPPPKYWQQFENLCLSVFRRVWGDPTAQKNGRSGQMQHGTDVWGYASGAIRGVQCKGKDLGLGASVTEEELRGEVEKAKQFTPALSHWILATTAPKDASIEAVAREITGEHEAAGLFPVQVLGWEDLQSLIAEHPSVIEEHYPNLAHAKKSPIEPATAIATARKDAESDLEKFRRAENITSAVVLGLEHEVDGKRNPMTRAAVLSAIGSGHAVLLEAEPGAGKSTTLLQLAAAILSENIDCVPVIVPLPEYALAECDLIDEISARQSFSETGRDALAYIAEAGSLAVLYDGWNEVPSDHRHQLRLRLAKFKRDFPRCGTLVATRAFGSYPFEPGLRLRLLSPTASQQLDILRERLGTGAEDLFARARRTPGLRDLLRTPLYVSFLGEVGGDGSLPVTKEEVIGRFVSNQEDHLKHRDALRDQLQNCHRRYLCAVAKHLTNLGAVAIRQAELRGVIGIEQEQLAKEHQISRKLDPQPIIDILVSHHVLVERATLGAECLYSFQHQQFQEWFASFYVEECIRAVSKIASADSLKALNLILDQSNWTESLIFAVERLSRIPGAGARQVANAIIRAIAIDPMLAAAMIWASTAETWDLIAEQVTRFAAEWFKGSDTARAFRFMVSTGRPEFADQVWEIIEENALRDQGLAPVFCPPAVLGANAQARYAKLSADLRRSLLWDLLLNGGQDGIEFALDACRQEPSTEVVQTVLELLEDGGTEAEFATLWQNASADVWNHLATHRPLAYATGGFRERLLQEKKNLANSLEGSQKRQLLLELSEAGEYHSPEEVIGLALETTHQNYQAEQGVLSRLAKLYPQQLSEAIIQRLIQEKPLPANASYFVNISGPGQQECLRGIALGTLAREGRGKEIAARALDTQSAQILIADLFSLADQMQSLDRASAASLRQKRQALTDALNMLGHEVLMASLLATSAEEPRHIVDLAGLLSRWRANNGDDAVPIDDSRAEQLCKAIQDWAAKLIAHPGTRGHDLSTVATAIKRVARPNLLPSLKHLLDGEIDAWRRDQAEVERQLSEGKPIRGGHTIFTAIYRQAFEAFQGENVRDILLGYIGSPEFEAEAAFCLRQYGTSDRIPSPAETIGSPSYEQVQRARDRRRNRPATESAVATTLLNRIDALIEAGEKGGLDRAFRMAIAAAQMDYGSRIGSINAVLTAPGSMLSRYDLLQTLLFSGEPISPANVVQGLEEALSKLVAKSWRSQNDWWIVGRWFELLALTEAPELVIEFAAKLPSDLKMANNFDRVVVALGNAEASLAFKTLRSLAEVIPGLEAIYSYPSALARVGSLEAANHLVSLSFDPQHTASMATRFFSEATVLAAALRKHPEAKGDFLARLTRSPKSLAPIHARVLAETVDQQDVLSLLQHCDPEGDDLLSDALQHGVRELAVISRAIEGTTNLYQQEPSDLSWLRLKLFRAYSDQTPHAPLAVKLLGIIDRQRDEYGRPPSEPRHPDIEAGRPWPPEAAQLNPV